MRDFDDSLTTDEAASLETPSDDQFGSGEVDASIGISLLLT